MEINQRKGVKPKMRGCELGSGVTQGLWCIYWLLFCNISQLYALFLIYTF